MRSICVSLWFTTCLLAPASEAFPERQIAFKTPQTQNILHLNETTGPFNIFGVKSETEFDIAYRDQSPPKLYLMGLTAFHMATAGPRQRDYSAMFAWRKVKVQTSPLFLACLHFPFLTASGTSVQRMSIFFDK